MKWGTRRSADQLVGKTIKAGTKMYRVTTNKNPDVKGNTTYVTYLKVDRDMYKGPMNPDIKAYARNVTAKTYEHKLTLNTDLKIPSLNEVRKIQDAMYKNPTTLSEIGKAQVRTILHQDNKLSYGMINELEKVSDKKLKPGDSKYVTCGLLGKEWLERNASIYKDWSLKETQKIKDDHGLYNYRYEWSMGSSPYNKNNVIEALKKKGYNAMYDNAGIGVGTDHQEGYEPLIVFDNSVLTDVKSKNISNNSSKLASDRFYNWYDQINKK